jgi:hypothetical protein
MSFLRRRRGGDKSQDTPQAKSTPEHHHDPDIDLHAPGWRAIDGTMDALYHSEPPFHYGTTIRWAVGGPDPLDGVSVYVNAGPPEHWHYVTYGLSELYAKESPNAEVSGWGLEFTFRVARTAGESGPPPWAWSFLQNLARHTFETGDVFEPQHTLNLNGPIALGRETAIRAAVFTRDPQLPAIETPNGQVAFVQVVGVTLDEYQSMKEWNTSGMLEVLRSTNPLLVTDLDRSSILDDPATAQAVATRRDAEGSSMAGLRSPETTWSVDPSGVQITTGALVVDGLQVLLSGRCALGRPATIWGTSQSIQFIPSERLGWHDVPSEPLILHLEIPPDGARELAATLRPVVGTYSVPSMPGLVVSVKETVVTDSKGNEVERLGTP